MKAESDPEGGGLFLPDPEGLIWSFSMSIDRVKGVEFRTLYPIPGLNTCEIALLLLHGSDWQRIVLRGPDTEHRACGIRNFMSGQ